MKKRTLSLVLALVMTVSTLLSVAVITPFTAYAADAKATSHGYVSDGLVTLYSGTQNGRDGHNTSAKVWEDLVGSNDMTVNTDSKNYFTDAGLRAEGVKHNLPKAIVDVVNGQTFTVELLFGEFESLGASFNTFLNSSNDRFALFRRVGTDQIEFKFAANPGDQRHKIDDGLNLLQNALITVTYEVGGTCVIYINGLPMAEKPSPSAMGADDLFIGHHESGKAFDTTYRSIRFYDRALTADEVKANAKADSITVPDQPTVTAPGYISVAQPATNITGGISAVREIGSAAELDAMLAGDMKPAAAIYTIDKSMNLLDGNGAPICTLDEMLAKTEYRIIPALRVADQATADALVTHLKSLRFYDCFVVSSEPAVIKATRDKLHTVSGVIDFTAAYKDATTLTTEQCLELRRTMKENNGTIAILPAALGANDTIQYLYEKQVNTWLALGDEPTELAQYNALLSGTIGIVSDATDSLLDIACEKLPENTMTRVTLNVGHRGIPSQAPENTLEGSIRAFEQGANVIELDIYITSDNEIVVMHDGTTGRTCNKNLGVEASTLAQLKELYVNKGFENDATFSKCRIPTLREYLEYFKGKDCSLFIEIKSGNTKIVAPTKALVDEYDMYGQCTVITFNEPIMSAMRKDWPEMHVGALCSGFMGGDNSDADLRSTMNFIGKYNATLNPSSGGFDQADIIATLRRGISIYPWTFRGGLGVYKDFFLWGYTGLTGDNADALKTLSKDIAYTGKTAYAVGESLPLTLSVTNYLRETEDKDAELTILAGAEYVNQTDTALEFKADGEVTILLSYRHRVTRTEDYRLYTQPITITIGDGLQTTPPDTEPPVTDTPTDAPTAAPTDAPTAAPSDDPTDAPATNANGTEAPTQGSDKDAEGCASTVSIAALLCLTVGAAMTLKRRGTKRYDHGIHHR